MYQMKELHASAIGMHVTWCLSAIDKDTNTGFISPVLGMKAHKVNVSLS